MSDLPFHHFLPGRSESSRDLIINIAYPPEMHKAAGRIRALIIVRTEKGIPEDHFIKVKSSESLFQAF